MTNMEGKMFLRCFLMFLLSTANVCGGTLETIRQQFEIYHRLPGEIEILAADDLKEIDNVLKRTETKRLIVRKELDKLDGLPPAQTPEKDLPSPLFAENYIVPFVHYVTVERAFASRSLQQGKPDDTVQAIRYVYCLADALAESGSLELRIVAARFRLQMLETAQSLLLHPLCRHKHHELLHKLLDDQINNRETDEVIWTRYREEGKQFFENMTRQGFDKMIAPNLLKELAERHAFRGYEKATIERFNHDRSVFHRVSEAIVESCAVPFFQRQQALRQLDTELREQRGTANEPVFTLLLLRDVSTSMRIFAQERSGIETAYLALSISLNIRNRQKPLNFLTGNEYEIRLIADGVMCTYEGNVKPFYVPYR
jgi:hypothetical protein